MPALSANLWRWRTPAGSGVAAGLAWGLLAGYARRLVPPEQQGRALAVAMLGAPLALSLGVPLGTWLGGLLGWRWAFGLLSLTALLLVGALAVEQVVEAVSRLRDQHEGAQGATDHVELPGHPVLLGDRGERLLESIAGCRRLDLEAHKEPPGVVA